MGACCSNGSSSETMPQQHVQPHLELQPQPQPQPQPHSQSHLQPSAMLAGSSELLPLETSIPTTNRMALPVYHYMEIQRDGISVSADHMGEFYVSFTYDAIVDGSVDIMFFGRQQGETFVSIYGDQGTVGRFTVTSGEGETFSQRTNFDLSRIDPQQLSNAIHGVFPLVLIAESADGRPLYTLVVLESRGNQQYVGRIIKRLGPNDYQILGEIAPTYEEEGGWCGVCMESYANESLLPCNHSVCSDCRVRLPSQKCPICRRRIEQVMVHPRANRDEDEDGDED